MNSSEKRRRARVQGGWASKDTSKIRSDDHKPEMPKVPAWLGKNADASNIQKYTYEEPVAVSNVLSRLVARLRTNATYSRYKLVRLL